MEQIYKQMTLKITKNEILPIIDSLLVNKIYIYKKYCLKAIYFSIKNKALQDCRYRPFSTRCAHCHKDIHYHLKEVYQLYIDECTYWDLCHHCVLFIEHLPIQIGDIVCKKYLIKIILLNDLLIKDVIYYIGVKMICS